VLPVAAVLLAPVQRQGDIFQKAFAHAPYHFLKKKLGDKGMSVSGNLRSRAIKN